MDDFKQFEQFLNERKQLQCLKRELSMNEQLLSEALQDGNLYLICDLKIQRDNLKDMIIELLETKLAQGA